MRRTEDYNLQDPTWCRGCGLYGIFAAFKKAAVSLDIDPEQLVICTGIGCHGRFNNYFKCYGFHALHGRVLPVAAGIRLANPRLTVLGISGDGDAYSIGLNHFLHSLRRNIDMTYVVVDNRIYALTQGQTSPTSHQGFVSVSSPYGSKETPLDGVELALAGGGAFIARGFSGDPHQLTSLFEAAIRHKGFSLVEVLSPCVTHNKINTYDWFKDLIDNLDEAPGYDPKSKAQAWGRLIQGDRIPTGLIYMEEKPSFEDLTLPGPHPLAFNNLSKDIPRIQKILKEFE